MEPWSAARRSEVVQEIEDVFRLLFLEMGPPAESTEESIQDGIDRVVREARRRGLPDATAGFVGSVLDNAQREWYADVAVELMTPLSELYSEEQWLETLWKSLQAAFAMPDLQERLENARALKRFAAEPELQRHSDELYRRSEEARALKRLEENRPHRGTKRRHQPELHPGD